MNIGLCIVLIVCGVLLAAALTDFRCTFIRTGDATFVVACSASRLEAHR